jgi:trehalose-6-phosphate synthase
VILDYLTKEAIENIIKKQVEREKDHLIYGVDTIDKLMYCRGKISALEALLQDIKSLQKEDNDGQFDKT